MIMVQILTVFISLYEFVIHCIIDILHNSNNSSN